jgi:hypothetical protein
MLLTPSFDDFLGVDTVDIANILEVNKDIIDDAHNDEL